MWVQDRLYPTVKEENKYRMLKRKYSIKDEIVAPRPPPPPLSPKEPYPRI